jgi:hypothetical protein
MGMLCMPCILGKSFPRMQGGWGVDAGGGGGWMQGGGGSIVRSRKNIFKMLKYKNFYKKEKNLVF